MQVWHGYVLYTITHIVLGNSSSLSSQLEELDVQGFMDDSGLKSSPEHDGFTWVSGGIGQLPLIGAY